jgi:CubicO group peptidase (beta-lactamase class C family)
MMDMENSANSWPLPFTKPENVGVSSERLGHIRASLQKYIDARKVPHLITLIARHGKIVHYEAQGYMDFENQKPIRKDAIFRLWSNTKPISGVATMICLEEGLLSLDEPVSRYIPAFKNPRVKIDEVQAANKGIPVLLGVTPTVPADREITVRDCLSNTTGLATVSDAPIQYVMEEFRDIIQETGFLSAPEKQPENIRQKVEALAKLPLESQPGTQYVYQMGFFLLSVILEMVTGKSLEEFYQERIFRPLGMKDTSFYLPPEKLERFPACYCPVVKSRHMELAVMEHPETSEKVVGLGKYFEAGGGAGGVLTTAGDYARFAQMLLNGGELDGVRLLGRKTVELMTSIHTGDVALPSPGPDFGFGLGVGVYKGGRYPGWRSIGTYGWSGAAGTIYFEDPKEDLIGVCFTQVIRHKWIEDNDFQEEFERLAYQSLI